MFIVIEGVDGCGKTTQAKKLAEWLSGEGHDVLLTAEPTEGRIGKFIREILQGTEEVDPKTLTLLFTADRYEHLTNKVEPAQALGKIAVSERYYHSTIAYQQAQGVDRDWIIELNRFAPKPDLVFLIDSPVADAVARTSTDEIFERQDFLEKVRDNYLEFDDVVKIDGRKSADHIFEKIRKNVGAKIKTG